MLREIRETKGITQIQLAKMLGVSERTIRKYEQEEDSMQIGMLKKIMTTLNMSSNSPAIMEKMSSNNGKNVQQYSKSIENMSSNDSVSRQTLNDQYYSIPKLNLSAQAGGGNDILDLQCYESGEVLMIDKAFFKATPSKNLKAIRVEGYSMIPMLMPDSWVIFENDRQYKGDGLYIINYGGQLMVKLLQLDPINRILDIVSVNKDYKSYSVSLDDSQVELIIAGKVLRCII